MQNSKNWVRGSGWKVKQAEKKKVDKVVDGKDHTCLATDISNKKVNTDNWKKQKRDSKGRFIVKKGK